MPEKSTKEPRRRTSSLHNVILHDMELEVLKQNISNKHKQMVREIDFKLDKIFDDFLNEVTKLSLNRFEVEKLFEDDFNGRVKKKNESKTNEEESTDLKKLPPRLKLPEKKFQPRNALLTDLFEIKHIKTIYHIFIVIFNLLLLNVCISDFADTGAVNIGLRPIITGFGGLKYAFLIWTMMQAVTIAIFPVFKIWGLITKKYFSKNHYGLLTKIWHTFGILLIIFYQTAFVILFTKAIVYCDMAQASRYSLFFILFKNRGLILFFFTA